MLRSIDWDFSSTAEFVVATALAVLIAIALFA
jgi:hypothetical protein